MEAADQLAFEQNPEIPIYGFRYNSHDQINLQVEKEKTKELQTGDEITIIFDPILRSISFSSENFKYK